MWFYYTGLRLVSVANKREHWSKRAKRTKEHRAIALAAVHGSVHDPALLLQVTAVRITRIAPRQLDGDNLQSSAKALRDGIADALGINDNDPRIEWQYAQEKGAPKQYGVRIELLKGTT